MLSYITIVISAIPLTGAVLKNLTKMPLSTKRQQYRCESSIIFYEHWSTSESKITDKDYLKSQSHDHFTMQYFEFLKIVKKTAWEFFRSFQKYILFSEFSKIWKKIVFLFEYLKSGNGQIMCLTSNIRLSCRRLGSGVLHIAKISTMSLKTRF